jgi:hypothetical protein
MGGAASFLRMTPSAGKASFSGSLVQASFTDPTYIFMPPRMGLFRVRARENKSDLLPIRLREEIETNSFGCLWHTRKFRLLATSFSSTGIWRFKKHPKFSNMSRGLELRMSTPLPCCRVIPAVTTADDVTDRTRNDVKLDDEVQFEAFQSSPQKRRIIPAEASRIPLVRGGQDPSRPYSSLGAMIPFVMIS